ncbi:MAG TPA: prolipoprotein diacylglyceryl transferase [Clostridiaceae bacterium]|nr:prolipoprotein diacylglyceryl transferase [Clostridiaceae bacterium]
MLPFINIFGLKISMYGLLIVLGVAIGSAVAVFFPSKKGIPKQDVIFSICYAGIGAILGAKILYLIITIPQLLNHEEQVVFSWELIAQLMAYGFVFYGGLIGGVLSVLIYAIKYNLHFFNLIEILVPVIPLIHSIGRLGCFSAGCCYVKPMDPPFGVHFHPDSVAPKDISLFPVQLLESVLNLILFVVIFVYSRRERRSGQILGLYFIGYSIIRFILEYFRYDMVRGIFGGLSVSQWISILLLPVGFYLLKIMKVKE